MRPIHRSAIAALFCGLIGLAPATETIFQLEPAEWERQIPADLRSGTVLASADGGLEVSNRRESQYAALNLPVDLRIAPDRRIRFEYRTIVAPDAPLLYLALGFRDGDGRDFFAKYPQSERWTTVTVPLDFLQSTDKRIFSEGATVRQLRIYLRGKDKAAPGKLRFLIRNLSVTGGHQSEIPANTRISYSANVLFDWKTAADARSYRLEISPSPDFPADRTQVLTTARNFIVPERPLTPGLWYYRAFALPQNRIVRFDRIWIPERHHTYRLANYDFAAVADAPHPRLTPLARFNARWTPGLIDAARQDLSVTVPPDGKPFQPGADPRFPTRIDWLRLHGDIVGNLGKAMTRIGQAALLTGDPQLTAKARELAVGVARDWDPEMASNRRYLDLHAGNLLIGLGFCYDAAYASMTPEERDTVNRAILARGRQYWSHINPFFGNEAQNHSWDNTHTFAFAAVAADGSPEREEWFDFALKLYAYRFLPSLGFDGENNEGLAYWRFGFNLVMRFLDLARQEFGIDLYQLDYVRKTASFGLYSAPLAGYELSFGDNGTPNHHGIWTYARSFCHKLAVETGNPEILWYATIPRDGKLRAAAPLSLPPSIHYPHIGVSFFNTFLPDARQNVALGFHSGKYFAGHQHADQNSFAVNAYGDKLLVDGGYYDWWGSAHFHDYATRSEAHNTLLVNGQGQAVRTFGADGITTAFADSPAIGYVAGDAGTNRAVYDGMLSKFDREIFFFKPDAIVTFDRVAAPAGGTFQYLLHAQGEAAPRADDAAGTFSIRRRTARLDGVFLSPSRRSVVPSFTTPPNDMVSSAMLEFHEKEWTIRAEFTGSEFLTAMEINRADRAPRLQFKRLDTPAAVGVAADGRTAVFNRTPGSACSLGGIATDARAAAVRFEADGTVTGALMIGGTRLSFRGRELCRLKQAGDWSLPAAAPAEQCVSDRILSLNGKPVPAELHTVTGGDGEKTHLLSAELEISEAGWLTLPDGAGDYLLGSESTRYIGSAPAARLVAPGRYLLALSGNRAPSAVRLRLTPASPVRLEALPADFALPENAIRLEAETPAAGDGEELYLIGRDFVSGGRFGLRFHQAGQALRWNFRTERPGDWTLLIHSASTDAPVREILVDGRAFAVRLAATGGDGRKQEDWRCFALPDRLTLPAGEHTVEIRFNRNTSSLDCLALIPAAAAQP